MNARNAKMENKNNSLLKGDDSVHLFTNSSLQNIFLDDSFLVQGFISLVAERLRNYVFCMSNNGNMPFKSMFLSNGTFKKTRLNLCLK